MQDESSGAKLMPVSDGFVRCAIRNLIHDGVNVMNYSSNLMMLLLGSVVLVPSSLGTALGYKPNPTLPDAPATSSIVVDRSNIPLTARWSQSNTAPQLRPSRPKLSDHYEAPALTSSLKVRSR